MYAYRYFDNLMASDVCFSDESARRGLPRFKRVERSEGEFLQNPFTSFLLPHRYDEQLCVHVLLAAILRASEEGVKESAIGSSPRFLGGSPIIAPSVVGSPTDGLRGRDDRHDLPRKFAMEMTSA
jgi:hypothetical protein